MGESEEQILLAEAFGRFRDLLEGHGVRVVLGAQHGDGHREAVWRVETGPLSCELAIQAYPRFTPRHVDQLVNGLSRVVRTLQDQPVLIVAPWLSPRSRELLTDHEINYLDLTGNVSVRVPKLPIIVRTDGASSDPSPAEQPRRGVQGRSVNGLVRALVDFTPPYRMADLARLTGLSTAYVSRTMEVLDDERLVERSRSRMIVNVDWQRLLRERADHYALIKSNRGRSYIARTGLSALTRAIGVPGDPADTEAADALYRRLLDTGGDQALLTGSFAVREYVQIAAPAQLALYVPNPGRFAERHGLMPADRGANVLLLQAADPSHLQRVALIKTTFQVGPSQLALDCLSGNGRLPEEGAALIEWMSEHTGLWRKSQLPEL